MAKKKHRKSEEPPFEGRTINFSPPPPRRPRRVLSDTFWERAELVTSYVILGPLYAAMALLMVGAVAAAGWLIFSAIF